MENLTTETKKLTQEEMDTLKDIQQRTQNITIELGQIELLKLQISERREQVETLISKLKEDETSFSNNLSENYGDCSIDPNTGEISPL